MTWHETIEYIQKTPEFAEIVANTYILPELGVNVERFRHSAEFQETLRLIRHYCPLPNPYLLDIGAGNGIASIAFALEGFRVVALEPDPSPMVGSGAIKTLVAIYELSNVQIVEAFGEELPFENQTFDIVYGRQVMHHAHHLPKFVTEAARVLLPKGLLFTTRDHVIKDAYDKQIFLKKHPLHGFYGGENAFRLTEYREAFAKASMQILEDLSPSQSVINYDPWNKKRLADLIGNKIGRTFATQQWLVDIGWQALMFRQERLSGKLYSFIARKE
ncbi:class I SAM-dependent methyltransferase [Runella limosa]|uniref:class I SAM-dependent methyltransferase n=1 Tax=Runella limosa TaxID=370978 RepID=UPI0004226FE8|nr:class I SAM-dependent methyltransferase [Runella limosa]